MSDKDGKQTIVGNKGERQKVQEDEEEWEGRR